MVKLDAAVRTLLVEHRFAVLGTLNDDGSAHLTVIWYGRRDDEPIVNTTAPRKKAANIARDPRVSLLVGESDRYVRLDGTARIVATGEAGLRDIHDLAVRYDGEAAAEKQSREVWSKQDRVTYAIAVRRIYRYGVD